MDFNFRTANPDPYLSKTGKKVIYTIIRGRSAGCISVAPAYKNRFRSRFAPSTNSGLRLPEWQEKKPQGGGGAGGMRRKGKTNHWAVGAASCREAWFLQYEM